MFVVVPLVFLVPGLLACLAVGLRGWRLAAASPAVTFGLVATGGPVLYALGVRWSLWSMAAWSVVVSLLLFVATRLTARLRSRSSAPTETDTEDDGTRPLRRAPWEHLAVGVGVVAGMAVGAVTFLRGTGGLDVISQEWDAPFHANAVRWIAEHGNAVAGDIAPIANIPAGDPYYYPITYHSLLATVVDQFGVSPSWALNAAALTVVMLWPLGIAAFGLAWRVPAPAVAVAAAVSTWFSAFPYDSLWCGPLWPFVAGVALLPGMLAVARLIIERYPVVPTAAVVALSVTGVVAMHPSLAFVVLVYVFALLAALVFRLEPFRWRGSAIPIAVIGVLTVMVLLPIVLPARTASTGVQGAQWPEFATPAEGFGQVLLLSPTAAFPQWVLGLTGIVGMVLLILRRRLLWVLAAFFVFGAAYAATASLNSPLVNTLSGPFYNDAWRFATLLPLLGAFAVAEAVTTLCTWLAPRLRLGRSPLGLLGVTAAAVVVLAVLGKGAYVNRNANHLDWMYGDGPTVSRGEEEAYRWLADHLEPGEKVMNDRLDGSVWMYAVAGVQPMEWTFYGTEPDSVPDTLHDRLNDMDDDPEIARMVEEANIRYVIVGRGFVRNVPVRAPGLQYLRYVDGLEQVFKNEQATIFEVVGAGDSR